MQQQMISAIRSMTYEELCEVAGDLRDIAIDRKTDGEMDIKDLNDWMSLLSCWAIGKDAEINNDE